MKSLQIIKNFMLIYSQKCLGIKKLYILDEIQHVDKFEKVVDSLFIKKY
ncbi:Uncharacterised protein [Fusobacterium necrophorum subsp. necrophorum]|nr:Uncharacterised protein [Fusobacterium necrophorum subsp. necrophorum]